MIQALTTWPDFGLGFVFDVKDKVLLIQFLSWAVRVTCYNGSHSGQ